MQRFYDLLVDEDQIVFIRRVLAHRMLQFRPHDMWWLVDPPPKHTSHQCNVVLKDINNRFRKQLLPLQMGINQVWGRIGNPYEKSWKKLQTHSSMALETFCQTASREGKRKTRFAGANNVAFLRMGGQFICVLRTCRPTAVHSFPHLYCDFIFGDIGRQGQGHRHCHSHWWAGRYHCHAQPSRGIQSGNKNTEPQGFSQNRKVVQNNSVFFLHTALKSNH